MIAGIILILIVISFVWALIGLKKEMREHKRINHAKKVLQREKIIFQR